MITLLKEGLCDEVLGLYIWSYTEMIFQVVFIALLVLLFVTTFQWLYGWFPIIGGTWGLPF
ncbi:hypothetical protein MtrunA17_Chr3g0113871 [Medicago truncatula]|uniref:Transmembrane protein n=1 Tax=Medicago truncatula TaxID=3880 RepID=A0A396IVN5_MEDTR|nr:hypothetical protein MtrunA17_Chr3g0113871 [Medicago truncatula]